MIRFIELTLYHEGSKTLFGVDCIERVIAAPDHCYIELVGNEGRVAVTESYEQVKAMLMGAERQIAPPSYPPMPEITTYPPAVDYTVTCSTAPTDGADDQFSIDNDLDERGGHKCLPTIVCSDCRPWR